MMLGIYLGSRVSYDRTGSGCLRPGVGFMEAGRKYTNYYTALLRYLARPPGPDLTQ